MRDTEVTTHLTSRAEGARTLPAFSIQRSAFSLGALGVLAVALCGCSGLHAPGFPAELSDVARQVGTSICDQAVWEQVLARLDGQIIEPGILTYGGTIYVAGGKLTGASGQLKLAGDGSGSGQLSPEARAALTALAQRPELLERLVEQLITTYTVQPPTNGEAPVLDQSEGVQ